MKLTFIIGYRTKWGESLVLRKGIKAWEMHWLNSEQWMVEVDREDFFGADKQVEYFYEVKAEGLSIRHEWRLHEIKADCKENTHSDKWSDETNWRAAGVAVPVFSLRTQNSFGVGEFNDLKMLVNWAKLTGQKMIQLLPVNDTTMTRTWTDSYPYNALSSFALHPQYLHLPAIGVPMDEEYCTIKDRLNANKSFEYEAVGNEKTRLARKAFKTTWSAVKRRKEYKLFFEKNSDWLMPYAVFSALRDKFCTADFSRWGEYSKFSESSVAKFCSEHSAEVDFYLFLQYHLDRQFSEVKKYAHENGVYLKGDLPIGVSRTSVDVWHNPRLFNTDSQAGAPPDYFSADGQNWGFPTYRWEEMEKDGYAWWRRRLSKMNEYFDAFRIDHILGFFRIWEIPSQYKSGTYGHFNPSIPYSEEEISAFPRELFVEDPRRKNFWNPMISALSMPAFENMPWERKDAFKGLYYDYFFHRHEDFWKKNGLRHLSSVISSTNMLVCGEDLGMIPACVPDVMQKLNILSLELQTMPKQQGCEYADTSKFPYFSVCTTSTHDVNPLRAWWHEDKGRTERYWWNMLHCEGEVPYECNPEIAGKIIDGYLNSPSMLCILPIQDYLALSGNMSSPDPADERINIPSICPYNWHYRMHVSLERLLADTEFNNSLKTAVKKSGR